MNYKSIFKTFSLALLTLVLAQSAGAMEAPTLAQTPNEILLNGISWDNAAQVTQSLNQGADVNCKDKNGDTALIIASKKGHTETAQVLLNNGADINGKNRWGWTPLMTVSANGFFEIAQMLLDRDADMYCTKNGKTALDYAICNKHNEIITLIRNAIERKKQVSLNKLLTLPKDHALFSGVINQAQSNPSLLASMQDTTTTNNLALIAPICGLNRK